MSDDKQIAVPRLAQHDHGRAVTASGKHLVALEPEKFGARLSQLRFVRDLENEGLPAGCRANVHPSDDFFG